jgi:two-component system, OmpR family, alkaline phosphatase synthesis response regulator PhoP
VSVGPSVHPVVPLILVADDDPDILALARFSLADCGYEVVTAVNGEDALELALARRPDVAVLDVHMPGLTGPEVASRIRQVESISDTAVILFSAAALDSDVSRYHEAGADQFLRKPFQLRQLVETVESVLGPWPAEARSAA